MDRRNFLTRSAIAGSGVLLADWTLAPEAAAQGCNSPRLPGVQLWSVRNLMPADPRGTLNALGGLGIREIEMDGMGRNQDPSAHLRGLRPEEFRAAVADAGMSMSFSHIGGDWSDTEFSGKLATELGIETVILALPEIFAEVRGNQFINMVGAKSLAQLDQLAERLNRAGAEYRDRGITFGYHNHYVEFIPVEGEIPFHYLMDQTDPALVKLEFDIAWLAAAGRDPAEYLRRYSNRVVSCHMKDFDSRVPLPPGNPDFQTMQTATAEPGAGTIDFDAVLQAMNTVDVRHAFIELESSDDPLGAIERGNKYLRQSRYC